MAIASLPAITAIPGPINDLCPQAVAHQINDVGAFRDLFFLVIIASVLGISNIADNLFRREFEYTSASQFLAVLAVAFYGIVLIFGIVHFASMSTVAVPDFVFIRDFWTITTTLAVSILVEIFVAFNDS